jgi:hypothetical protein
MSFLQGFNASSTVRIGDALKPLAFFYGGAGIGLGSSTPSALWGLSIGTTTVIQNAQFAGTFASSSLAAATYTVNWEQGNNQRFILNQNTVIIVNATTSNPVDGAKYILKLCQDGTGSRTLTWATPGQLNFVGGNGATTTVMSNANSLTTVGLIYDAPHCAMTSSPAPPRTTHAAAYHKI